LITTRGNVKAFLSEDSYKVSTRTKRDEKLSHFKEELQTTGLTELSSGSGWSRSSRTADNRRGRHHRYVYNKARFRTSYSRRMISM